MSLQYFELTFLSQMPYGLFRPPWNQPSGLWAINHFRPYPDGYPSYMARHQDAVLPSFPHRDGLALLNARPGAATGFRSAGSWLRLDLSSSLGQRIGVVAGLASPSLPASGFPDCYLAEYGPASGTGIPIAMRLWKILGGTPTLLSSAVFDASLCAGSINRPIMYAFDNTTEIQPNPTGTAMHYFGPSLQIALTPNLDGSMSVDVGEMTIPGVPSHQSHYDPPNPLGPNPDSFYLPVYTDASPLTGLYFGLYASGAGYNGSNDADEFVVTYENGLRGQMPVHGCVDGNTKAFRPALTYTFGSGVPLHINPAGALVGDAGATFTRIGDDCIRIDRS